MHASLAFLSSALLVALVSGATLSTQDLVYNASRKCAAETKVTPEQAMLSVNSKIPKTDAEKCYLQCCYIALGAIKDGKYNDEGARRLAALKFPAGKERDLANDLVTTCARQIRVKDGEKCSLGRAIRECYATNGKEVNFFPASA